MNKRKIVLSAAFALALGLAGTAAAQTSSGNIIGEGKAGDVVVIENVDTGFVREVKVKEDGRYQMRRLPTGTFHVTVRHADGSAEETKTVTLHGGVTARVQ
jgi:outer membrane lipoprotein SlyB